MRFQKAVILAEYSNYKIGGPAKFFCEARNIQDIKSAVKTAQKSKIRIFILGGGTNILFNDSGFNGLVIRPNLCDLKLTGDKICAGAGVLMSDLLNFAAQRGLSGLEWAGGLPGTLGGAIRGNAGCFGGEIKDVVESVESLDVKNLQQKKRLVSACGFSYRSSIFKKKNGQEIILGAVLKLKPRGQSKQIKAAIQEKINYRKERHPLEYPNIGSVFKNVNLAGFSLGQRPQFKPVIKIDPFPIVPVAHLISEAGLKGVSCGGAMVSPKHPNFIVNILAAKAADVRNLIQLAEKEVKKKFKVDLEAEIEIV